MFQIRTKQSKKALTLIEIILTLGLISIIAIGSIPFVLNNLKTEENNLNTSIVVNQLKLARSYALSSFQNDSWGVNFGNNSVVLFKGDSFTNRDTSYDIVESVNSNSIQTSITSIIFEKFSGNSSNIADINILSDIENTLIKVHQNGLIEF